MDKKKIISLISSIFIMVAAVVVLLALFTPYLEYHLWVEPVDNVVEFNKFKYSLFSSSLANDMSDHFFHFKERAWLMFLSDAMIIIGIVTIVLTFILGLLEGLSFIPTLNGFIKKFKNWFGLAVIIVGGLFLLISFIFFLGSNQVYKIGTTNSGYNVRQWKGSFGWWAIGICSLLGGILAFRKGFKKFNVETL